MSSHEKGIEAARAELEIQWGTAFIVDGVVDAAKLDMAAIIAAYLAAEAPPSPCADCCCARVWAALGITDRTDHSAYEHVEMLKAERDRLAAALLRRPPLAVMLAVEVLCNHVEPGWDNSKTIVRAWIDEERATRAALAGEK